MFCEKPGNIKNCGIPGVFPETKEHMKSVLSPKRPSMHKQIYRLRSGLAPFLLAMAGKILYAVSPEGLPWWDQVHRTPYRNAYVRLYDPEFQKHMAQQEFWREFVRQANGWRASFDPYTGNPLHAWGPPLPLPDGKDWTERISAFLQQYLPLWWQENHQRVQWQVNKVRKSPDGKIYVDLEQMWKDRKVLGAVASFRIREKDAHVFFFSLRVFPVMEEKIQGWAEGHSPLPEGVLLQSAVQDLPASDFRWDTIFLSGERFLIPVFSEEDGIRFHDAVEVFASGEHIPTGHPMRLQVLVDPFSGEVIYRINQVRFWSGSLQNVPVALQVNARVCQYNCPITPVDTYALPRTQVIADGSPYTTDTAGAVVVNVTSLPAPVDVPLQGVYFQAVYVPLNGVLSVSQTVSSSPSTILVEMNNLMQYPNAYFHAVKIYRMVHERHFPFLLNYRGQMTVFVDDTSGGCNAFYDFQDIYLFAEDNTCNAMGLLGDVVYHEFGHGINHLVYQYYSGSPMGNGAMHEGYADVWAIYITRNPRLGQGFFKSSNAPIRRYDQAPRVYPDDLTGLPHQDGQIVAGAWWDTYQNLGDIQYAMQLFAEHYAGTPDAPDGQEGVAFQQALMEALIADDDDGDLSNGTPNFTAIVCAFERHGIILSGGGINAVRYHPEPLLADTGQVISLEYRSTNFSFPFAQGVSLYWRIWNASSWNRVAMLRVSGDSFVSYLGPFPAGTIIEYWFEDTSGCGGVVSVPANSHLSLQDPNVRYFLLVGFELRDTQTLTTTAGWVAGDPSDNATTGQWTFGDPVPTYVGNEMVQPDRDHTGNNLCAFTGNANPGDPPGTNDVDNGKTTLYSPPYNLIGYVDPVFTYWRWFSNEMGANPQDDPWRVEISLDGGVSWQVVENTYTPDRSWRRVVVRVRDYGTPSASVMLRFIASDYDPGSLVEAAIDDLFLYDALEGGPSDTTGGGGGGGADTTETSTEAVFVANPDNVQLNWHFAGNSLKMEVLSSTNKLLSIRVLDVSGKELHRSFLPPASYQQFSLPLGTLTPLIVVEIRNHLDGSLIMYRKIPIRPWSGGHRSSQ